MIASRFRTLALVLAAGCAVPVGMPEAPDLVELDPLDVTELDDGKADGASSFDRHRVIEDGPFVDTEAMSADAVQRFLEATPYGGRSFLADERIGTERFADALVRVARADRLNPLVLLATLQKEAGLISRTSAPSRQRVDFAFGCGCPDGRACIESFRGLDRQLACAADVYRASLDSLAAGDTTRAGYRVGSSLTSLDGLRVTPVNAATAALYTYTPWVGREARSGNWLFWNVWRRYAAHVSYEAGLTRPFNEGFVGGACDDDADCAFTGGFCHRPSSGDPAFCTQRCTVASPYCPDRAGHASTFCVDLEGRGEGLCVAQCDARASEPACLDGQACEWASRLGQTVERAVCR